MSSTTVSIVLRQHEKPDKTRSLNLRITHNRKIAYIALNTFVSEDEWLPKEQEIHKKCKRYENISRVNDYLLRQKLQAKSKINDLYDAGNAEYLSVTDIKKAILDQGEVHSFETFTKQIIKEMKAANRHGNASIYETTMNFVIKNNDGKDLMFQKINYQYLKQLETTHLAAGNAINSLSVYMRTLRAIFNRAIKENIAKKDWYPFDKYSIKNTKTKKRAISKEDIKKIEDYNPEDGSQRFHARNYFLFSFYMIGLNFADIAFIKPSNIINGRLEYTRKKTNKNYSLALFDKPQKILDHYKKGKKKDEYIFPIIKREDPEWIRKDIKNGLKTFNKYLRKIADELEIEGEMSSYVARHSWATIGKFLNVPIQVISEGLGHDSIQTTQIYLDSFDKNVIDDASLLITG